MRSFCKSYVHDWCNSAYGQSYKYDGSMSKVLSASFWSQDPSHLGMP